MKARTQITLVLAMIAALLAATPGVGAQENPTTDPPKAEIASAAEFREALLAETGFTVDEWLPAWNGQRALMGFPEWDTKQLARFAVSSNGQETYFLYGLPLRANEVLEMDARNLLSSELFRVEAVAAKMSGYAGVTIAIGKNGKQVATVNSTEKLTAADQGTLRALVSDESRLRYSADSRWSLRDLERQAEDLVAAGRFEGAAVHTVGIDLETNVVAVSIDPAEATRLNVEAGISDGVEVRIVEPAVGSACSNRVTCDQPLRAGVNVDNLNRSTSCTTGFAIEDNTGDYFMTTAAHCGANGQSHRISNIATRTQDDESISVDVAIIDILTSETSNVLFRTQGDTLRRIKSRAIANVGNTVCLHAPQVGRSCGSVTDRDIGQHTIETDIEGQQLFTNAFEYTLVLPGDWVCDEPVGNQRQIAGSSGGAITNPWGAKAHGTMSGCFSASHQPNAPTSTVTLWAAHIHEALPDFNATLVTSPP